MAKDDRKLYRLTAGKHSYRKNLDDTVETVAEQGDMVPLTEAQYNNFKDKFQDVEEARAAAKKVLDETDPKTVVTKGGSGDPGSDSTSVGSDGSSTQLDGSGKGETGKAPDPKKEKVEPGAQPPVKPT